jgi:tRNA pseudouridine38-40 synthase
MNDGTETKIYRNIKDEYYHDANQSWNVTTELGANDVLLGRGTGPNDTEGNKRYRQLIAQRKLEYTNVTCRREKNQIAESIYDEISTNRQGRFVTKLVDQRRKPSSPGATPTAVTPTVRYVVAEKSVVLEKIRQSLRQLNKVISSENTTTASTPSTGTVALVPATAAASGKDGDDARDEAASSPLEQNNVISRKAPPPQKQQQQQQQLSTTYHANNLQRYKLTIAYNGERYKGYQRQSSSSSSTTTAYVVQQANNDKDSDGKRNCNKHSPVGDVRHFKKRKHDEITGKVRPVPMTVQETLEGAIEHFSGLHRDVLKVRSAGRTDAGVHARGQVVAISLPKPLDDEEINDTQRRQQHLWQIRKSINSRLPVDISVEDVSICNDRFDPRLDALWKQYSYTLRYRRSVMVNKNNNNNNINGGKQDEEAKGEVPLEVCTKGGPQLLRSALDATSSTCWLVPWPLDDTRLDFFCCLLTGTHDYSAFVHKDARKERENTMTVRRVECQRIHTASRDGAPICDVRFVVEAKGFGRSQVRNMIGFLVDLCRGAIKDTAFRPATLWANPDELAKEIHAAPACGLCLEKVVYSDDAAENDS